MDAELLAIIDEIRDTFHISIKDIEFNKLAAVQVLKSILIRKQKEADLLNMLGILEKIGPQFFASSGLSSMRHASGQAPIPVIPQPKLSAQDPADDVLDHQIDSRVIDDVTDKIKARDKLADYKLDIEMHWFFNEAVDET